MTIGQAYSAAGYGARFAFLMMCSAVPDAPTRAALEAKADHGLRMSDTLDGGMWALGGAIAGKAIDALVLSWCTTGRSTTRTARRACGALLASCGAREGD